MQGHIAGHTDAISQRPQGRRRAGGGSQGGARGQPGEGAAQSQIEALRQQGLAGQQRAPVLYQPLDGHQGRIGWLGLGGFRIGLPRRRDRPGAPVDPSRQILLLGTATGLAAPQLGRQVVGVGMKIALAAEIAGAPLQGREPALDGGMLAPQQIALVIGQ